MVVRGTKTKKKINKKNFSCPFFLAPLPPPPPECMSAQLMKTQA